MMFHRNGLPLPLLQGEVHSAAGKFLGRVDFYDPEAGVVGEFDGRMKYGRLLKPGQEPGDAVFDEKRREDAIRDTGLLMVRWTWTDLADLSAAHRWQRALEHTRRPSTARATITPAPLPEGHRPQVQPFPHLF
ncbi:hypothetical protein [Nocardia sp. NPDC049149]|uniref:hypothetical protein n=1 Tax=Nocardia sp. NPDC049149 TaxID=3364315 RepID=UPI00372270BB